MCRYIIPGGSAGHFHREGYTFDVGSSMMFGMGHEGTTNLITRALAAVGKNLDTVPDPTQIHYHLPRSQAHPNVGLPHLSFLLPCISVLPSFSSLYLLSQAGIHPHDA